MFDGVVPPTGGAGGAGGTGGAGGAGTGGESYLGLGEAIKVCSEVRTCAGLAEAIRMSTGVPVGAESFSTCLTWLAGPVAAADRQGFPAQQGLLQSIAAADGCSAMLALTYLEPAPAPCTPGCSGDGAYLDDCTHGVRLHCKSALFDDGTGTSACSVGGGEARCFSSACCVSVTGGQCRKPDEAALCISGSADVCWDIPGGEGGYKVVTRCPDLGLACEGEVAVTPMDGAVLPCAPTEAECATNAPSCADGETVRSCIAGIPTLFECAPVGALCAADAGGAPFCAPPGGCAPSETACAGASAIDVCLAGKARRVDCGAGRSCVPAAGGKSAGCQAQ